MPIRYRLFSIPLAIDVITTTVVTELPSLLRLLDTISTPRRQVLVENRLTIYFLCPKDRYPEFGVVLFVISAITAPVF